MVVYCGYGLERLRDGVGAELIGETRERLTGSLPPRQPRS